MRSSRFVLARLAGLLFTGAPLLVLVFIVAGLYAADRGLAWTDDARMQADAAEAAARTERLLDVHIEALHGFRGLYTPGARPFDEGRFGFLLSTLEHRTARFQRLWITDGSGIVVADTAPGAVQQTLRGVDLDTLTELGIGRAVAAARTTRRPALSAAGPLFSGERALAMAIPVIAGDSVVGAIVGTILTDTILRAIRTQSAENRTQVIITSGKDTIAAAAVAGRPATTDEEEMTARVPDGSIWEVHVSHQTTTGRMRIALWAIGLSALAMLIIGSVRERRQSQRIAERSQELEHLSTELLHANRAKSEFLANVSHELRTPLNAIVGFVDLLRDGVYGELAPRQVGPVERIAASGTHLRHLVDQVLDLAKITAGRLEVHTDVVDLRAFVLDIAGEMEALVTERGLALSLAVGTTLPRLRTDPTHLRQILVNLIGNAIKYTNAGSVSVRARLVGAEPAAGADDRPGRVTPSGVPVPPLPTMPAGVWIAIQVIDTGIGIAESDLERIFDEFEQVGAGPRGESMQRGTGLGLSISRRLARLLGGDISVESALGQGSTFTLWLPVDPADLKLAEARRSPPRPRQGLEA